MNNIEINTEFNEQNNLSGEVLLKEIKSQFGINCVTGLPCGELREFIDTSCKDKELLHIQSTNEREAVGIAAGVWLGDKKPVLYMQNSGLFVCSNEIGSLLIPSKIPAVFVVSWRGCKGETATQHLTTGEATIPLLESFHLHYTTESNKTNLMKLKKTQEETNLPVCILKTRENFNNINPETRHQESIRKRITPYQEETDLLESRETMLAIIAKMTPKNRALISSTGLISRSLYQNFDSPNQFYNAGAFGLTSSIGLGFALAEKQTPVTVVEGDGSVLTNWGNLNLIGYHQPENFLHIVLDNGAYVSCSGEKTIGSELIVQTASICGYTNVFSVASIEMVNKVLQLSNDGQLSGPTLLHIRINTEGERNFKRPLEMDQTARRFKNHFLKTEKA